MGNCKLPCAWVGVLMTPPNYGKIRQAKGKVGVVEEMVATWRKKKWKKGIKN